MSCIFLSFFPIVSTMVPRGSRIIHALCEWVSDYNTIMLEIEGSPPNEFEAGEASAQHWPKSTGRLGVATAACLRRGGHVLGGRLFFFFFRWLYFTHPVSPCHRLYSWLQYVLRRATRVHEAVRPPARITRLPFFDVRKVTPRLVQIRKTQTVEWTPRTLQYVFT